MLSEQARKASEQIIDGSSTRLSELWETLESMSGNDAAKLIMEVAYSEDGIVSQDEMVTFAWKAGVFAD